MKRLVAIVLVIMTSGGCDDYGAPPSAYRNWEDRLVVAAGLRPLFWPCMVKETNALGVIYASIPVDQCYRMDPPQRWRGMWRNEFEGSRFCPAPAKECSYDTPGDKVWFDYSFGVIHSKPTKWKVQPGELYAVDFIGRRTAVKGRYGHLGGSDYEVVVDRIISTREIEPPPAAPTAAEELASWKQCLAAKTCVLTAEGKARMEELMAQVK